MIKKFIYILICSALLCSCVEDILPEQSAEKEEIGVEHDGRVTLGLNVNVAGGLEEGTKALTETPDIKNIYVAVFDSTGYKLSEYVKADPITTGPENDEKYQFTIKLKISDKPRILHFIANAPQELRFGSEQEVIGELFTSYDADESDEYSRKDAYWQRLVFSKIAPRPEGTDDGSQAWQDYNTMVDTLSNLKLIRNFSKVTLSKREPVTEDTALFKSFQILGMWFVNYPDRGSIAPYNRNTGDFGTENKTYLEYNNMAEVEALNQGNYQGFTLASTNFITPSVFDASNMIAATSNTASGYVYEREKALTSPMYLIIKCSYNSAETYYKVAMQDEEGKFYAMLRNFVYNVQIRNVTAAGYPTAAAALKGAPTGDISVNIDYQDLPNISDGNARITVNATKLLIVGTEGETTSAKFWYKYEPDITEHGETGIHNDPATGTEATDKANPHVVISYAGTEGSTGAVIDNISVATSNEGGNRYVTINTTAASATPKTQTISIEGRRWNGSRYMTITRSIQLVLRDALEMSLYASPNTDSENAANVLAQKDQPVVLHIGIEQDLPASMFPLYFKLDPSVKSLTPDNSFSSVQELPVRTGTDENGRPTYWFEKSISLKDYEDATVVDGKKQFAVYFKTMRTSNATSIEVSNEYFVTKAVQVKNYTPKSFSNLAFSGTTHKVAQAETFSFTMSEVPADHKVTVAMKNIEPESLTGFKYLGEDSEGYWTYEYAVSSTSGSFSVVPYLQGTAEIKLSAYLFNDASATAKVIPGEILAGTILFKDGFGTTNNVAIGSYTGSGISSDYNKTGVTYSVSGTNTSISTTSTTNMSSGHIRYSSSSSGNSNTVTISNIQAYGAKKFTLSFNGYISNTSRVSGTYSINGGTAKSIVSGSNRFDFELGDSEETIRISFVITHATYNYQSGTLGIDDVTLTTR